MIQYYSNQNGVVTVSETKSADTPNIFWYDIINPTKEDEAQIESLLGIDLPTREEMQELEVSARLYKDDQQLFAIASFPVEQSEDDYANVNITFVVSKDYIVTMRYMLTRVITPFATKLLRKPAPNAQELLLSMMEAFVAAFADMLEKKTARLDGIGRTIFTEPHAAKTKSLNSFSVRNWRSMLQNIGMIGQKLAVIREGLVSFSRMATFLHGQTNHACFDKEASARLATIERDSTHLSEHADYLSDKVSFLLEATLGLLNVEQNQIIKLFSVVSVVLMPPTLVASIYGMNFEWMPELKWHFGYPATITLMVLSAILPFVYFKFKKWL
ncbi:MAG: magnesium transporter CorA family protein [Alphaproteobacteria bacterium]|nr:magnesium transporter CorA family protein [Alphaproteobacteria bacterium]